MKVLLIGDYPPPYGGIAVQIQHLARILPETGVESRVLDIGRGRGTPNPDCDSPRGKIDLALKLFRYARSNYLLHLFTNGENWKSWGMALAVTGAARLARARALLTITSGGAPAYLTEAPLWVRTLARLVVSLAASVVCRTDAIAQALRLWRANGLVVLPAFSISRVRPAEHPPEAVVRFSEAHSPLLVSVVILRGEYDLPTLLRAFRDLRSDFPGAGLVVVGGGEDEVAVREVIRSWRLEDSVLMTGWVRHEECLAIIRQADLFVRTTLYDGDASSVREALALGVPVVASRTDFRPEGVVLVPPGDPGALRSALGQVLTRRPALHEADPSDSPSPDQRLVALYTQVWNSANGSA